MKIKLILLILINLYKGVFSLEISYIRSIEPFWSRDGSAFFCDDAQTIIYSSYVIDVQDGTKTNFDYSREKFYQLNRFCCTYKEDKFGRVQRILFSFEHGIKLISDEVLESLRRHIRVDASYRSRYWRQNLYGNSGVRESDSTHFVDSIADSWGIGIEFFSDSNQSIDLPVEMKYAFNDGSINDVNLSYDLFTGTFIQYVYYDGTGLPDWTSKLHIFNLIYDGILTNQTEIRETPSHDGKVLGYLNEGESVKVSKAENFERKEDYQDYWYYVTTDSYSGWCTGEFLLIEGGTWQERLELRGPYVEWDEIPESEDILKTPLYGLITSDTNVYDKLPANYLVPKEGVLEFLEASPISGKVQKDSVVEIIDRTGYRESTSSGVSTSYVYYKIRLKNGIEGWVLDDDIDEDFDGTEILDKSTRIEIVNFEPLQDGVMNDTRVRLRSAPNLESETLGHLNTGDKVTIIDKSAETQKIDDMEDYWYKVRTYDFPDGWVYGAFIDIEEEN